MVSMKNSTLLGISHIEHIICGEITTRIFLGASGFWHSSSFWICVVFFFFLNFSSRLISRAANLQTGGAFTLSVPTTFPFHAFVSGSSFNGVLLGACLLMCVCLHVFTWIFLKMLGRTVSKCRRVRTYIVQQTEDTTEAAFVVSEKVYTKIFLVMSEILIG